MKLLDDERGSITLFVALSMVAVLGFLALAIDVGQLRYARRNLQSAVDAAALASALELNLCAGVLNCPAMQNATLSALVENNKTPGAVVLNCGPVPATGLVLMINNPPCALGPTDPNYGKTGYVETLVIQPQETTFATLLGFTSVPVSVHAEATTTGSTCIYALDPSGSGALTVDQLAAIASPCAIMVESSSTSALSCSLGAIAASKLGVVGGVSNAGCLIVPGARTNALLPTPTDPLAYLQAPVVPACGTTTASPFHGAPATVLVPASSSATFYPDHAYCGGITIKSGAAVTFQPGTYSLTSTNAGASRSPGGLTIDLGTTITGIGVTFYNYGPSGGILFNQTGLGLGGVHFVAPTSGTYAGILFFQPSNNVSQAALLGLPLYNTVLEGTYYFPAAKVLIAFSGVVNYNILVAYRIEFQALTVGFTTGTTSVFTNNYTTLSNGSPVPASGAVMSQ